MGPIFKWMQTEVPELPKSKKQCLDSDKAVQNCIISVKLYFIL